MALYCSQCKGPLPAAAQSELWEYRSGRMRFCTRECMEQKKQATAFKISQGRRKKKPEPFSLQDFEPVPAGKVMTREELKAQLTADLAKKPLMTDVHVQEQDDGLLVTGKPTDAMIEMINEEEEKPMETAEKTLEYFDPDMFAATQAHETADARESEIARLTCTVLEQTERISQLERRNAQLAEDKDAWRDRCEKLEKRLDTMLATSAMLMDMIRDN